MFELSHSNPAKRMPEEIWNASWIPLKAMRRIPFGFFVRVILLAASAVLAVLSVSTHTTSQEFAYAAGSIASAMLAGMFRRKRRTIHPTKRHVHPAK